MAIGIKSDIEHNHPKGLRMVVGGRTVVTSCAKILSGKPSNLIDINRKLAGIAGRFPGAIIDRYYDLTPTVADGAHVFPGAALIGDVRLAENVSVWYNCVVRGDINYVEIGKDSNIQDGTVIHVGDNNYTAIGPETVVGHRAVIHACTIGGGVLVGMNATVLDGSVVGDGCIIAAGSVVSPGKTIPPRSLVAGVPGKVIKTLTEDDEAHIRQLAGKYGRLLFNYLNA